MIKLSKSKLTCVLNALISCIINFFFSLNISCIKRALLDTQTYAVLLAWKTNCSLVKQRDSLLFQHFR